MPPIKVLPFSNFTRLSLAVKVMFISDQESHLQIITLNQWHFNLSILSPFHASFPASPKLLLTHPSLITGC